MVNVFTELIGTFKKGLKYDELQREFDNMVDLFNISNSKIDILETEKRELQGTLLEYVEIIELQDSEIEDNKPLIDVYCEDNYKVIEPIAYQQKRDIEGEKYPISLQELITPNSYSILKLKKKIKHIHLHDGLPRQTYPQQSQQQNT